MTHNGIVAYISWKHRIPIGLGYVRSPHDEVSIVLDASVLSGKRDAIIEYEQLRQELAEQESDLTKKGE